MPHPGRRVTAGTVLHGAAQGTAASHREPRLTRVTPRPPVSPRRGRRKFPLGGHDVVPGHSYRDKQRTRPRRNKRGVQNVSAPDHCRKLKASAAPAVGTLFGPGRKRHPAGGHRCWRRAAHRSGARRKGGCHHAHGRRIPGCVPVQPRDRPRGRRARRRGPVPGIRGPRHRPPGDVPPRGPPGHERPAHVDRAD